MKEVPTSEDECDICQSHKHIIEWLKDNNPSMVGLAKANLARHIKAGRHRRRILE